MNHEQTQIAGGSRRDQNPWWSRGTQALNSTRAESGHSLLLTPNRLPLDPVLLVKSGTKQLIDAKMQYIKWSYDRLCILTSDIYTLGRSA